MIPKECKRLAEVDFPIAEVSRHSAREKAGPRGHPSTLHLWWARRPLAACRAMLMALLLPDPVDELCPPDFKSKARELLPDLVGTIKKDDLALRKALLKFIADFANWDNSAHPTYLNISRGLVKAAHPEETPLVVDPFAGGGSIPLEALRIGCDAFASDLNPVACLILKVMLEDIPRHGPELAEELRRVGAEIKKEAEKELAEFYPNDQDGATPIVYLWARTVKCESPNCGAEIPIYKTGWLSKKGASGARFFREDPEGKCTVLIVADHPLGGPVRFRIMKGHGSEDSRPGFVEIAGTKAKGNNANVVCPCCGGVLPGNKKNPRTPTQLMKQRGGSDVVFDDEGRRVGGARLLAVVTLKPGQKGRHYRLPTDQDYGSIWQAQKRISAIMNAWQDDGMKGLCPVPDELLPPIGTLGFRVQRYGILQWGNLYTARQKVALIAWGKSLRKVLRDNAVTEVMEVLSLAMSRVALCGMSLTNWNAYAEKMQHTYGRQALPMVWDFAEVVSIRHTPGAWQNAMELAANVASVWPASEVGQVQLSDAAASPIPDGACGVWFTDPPYYDAVPYADLSDLFFVWLKRFLRGHSLIRDPFDSSNTLTPKTNEIVQDETKEYDGQCKDRIFFEAQMAVAFAEGRRKLTEGGIGLVVFAHKTTEGWEALLSGMIKGGWTITGSWPIATEMGSRLRARESAALATSVHLVCRPRPGDATTGDWGDVLGELPNRVGVWMERLQSEGIRGADLVFACIGPALEIFSRYSSVETADGKEVKLDAYLEKVWEVVGRIALENILGTDEAQARNGMAGALEEDSRLTALFLWTLQSTEADITVDSSSTDDDESEIDADDEADSPKSKVKGFSLVYDVARRFAQPLGIHLDAWEGRIIETKKGVVRLLSVAERAMALFGEAGASAVAYELETDPAKAAQFELALGVVEAAPKIKSRGRRKKASLAVTDKDFSTEQQATTLDRVHAAMLLQKAGRTNALRALLKAEQQRSPDFIRLANALSALYPKNSEEKRLLDAMLLAVPR